MILTTCQAAYSDPGGGLELNTVFSRQDNFLKQQPYYNCCFQQNWFLSAKQQQPLSNSLSFAYIHVDPNQNILNAF